MGGPEECNLVVSPAASLRPSAERKAPAELASFGTAEAVPLRSWVGLGDGRERSRWRAMPTLATIESSRRWVTRVL
jgi:hypothetical protein